MNGAVGIGYDTDVLVESREQSVIGSTVSLTRTADYFALFGGGVYYEDHGEHYDFGASIQSQARQYPRYSTMRPANDTVTTAPVAVPAAPVALPTAPGEDKSDRHGKSLLASFAGKTRRLAFPGRKGVAWRSQLDDPT